MKAPDKIYIGIHNENVQTGYFSRNKDYVFTQEYIRKDALLEWANGVMAKKDISSAMRIALRVLISKINAL